MCIHYKKKKKASLIREGMLRQIIGCQNGDVREYNILRNDLILFISEVATSSPKLWILSSYDVQ